MKDIFILIMYFLGFGEDSELSPTYEEDLSAWEM